MPRFKWHAHYFDGSDGQAAYVRRTIIEADYGDEAEKIAKAQMGLCDRVEVKRVATSGPARVIYAANQTVLKTPPLADIFALPGTMPESRETREWELRLFAVSQSKGDHRRSNPDQIA
jgi:hypothetical protein